MEDKTLSCVHCGNPFIFTISEQERHRAFGFAQPRRCKDCRKKKVNKVPPTRYEVKMKYRRRQSEKYDAN
jgi:hypothetical protein